MLMSELQYWSPGKCIYYWFGDAYGIIQSGENAGKSLYLGSETDVKEALSQDTDLSSSKPRLAKQILKAEKSKSENNPSM
jgi:hypothetical protein